MTYRVVEEKNNAVLDTFYDADYVRDFIYPGLVFSIRIGEQECPLLEILKIGDDGIILVRKFDPKSRQTNMKQEDIR